jgi:histidinol phosphatase-like PHP family hydrolase
MRFDLHIHSKHSPDSNSSVKDIIGTAKARGLMESPSQTIIALVAVKKL